MKVQLKDNTGKYYQNVKSNMRSAATDIKNDWRNTARGMAPHKKGNLEKGINAELQMKNSGFKIEISAQAEGSNGYNYAKKMHESSYSLGKKSISKGSGNSGMSGKSYPVGKGYLTKPLAGNFSSYKEHMQKALNKSKI